jgi:putative ABC transport system permease protein
MPSFLADLRYGLRTLAQRPGFTLAAVAALALGLGANTAIFSVVDGVVLRPLPFPAPDRLVALWETQAAQGLDHERLSPVNFLDFRGLKQVFADAAAWWHPEVNLADDEGEPVRVTTVETSANLFAVLGVEPQLGPGFAWQGGDLHASEAEAVVSDGLWRRRYGADPGILGKTLQLNGRPYTVVGVMPPGFRFPGETDVWQRLAWNYANHSRFAHFTEAVARLAPGATVERAQAELAGLAGRLATEFPASNRDWSARAVPLDRELVGDFRPKLLVLSAAVGLLLLLACANVANLLLARASSREREAAMRSALGAGRGRLLAQFLTESLLLAALGAVAGLGLAWTSVRLLVTAAPIDIPRLAEVGIDARVLLFCLAATVATGLAFGLVPALQLSGRDLHATLKEGARGAGDGRAGRRVRGALVVAEVALAVLVLTGAGLLFRSFVRLLAEEPGFRPERVATMNLQLPASTYQDWNQVAGFFGQLVERLEAHPAIASAGASGFLPLEPGWRVEFVLPDRPAPAAGEEPTAQHVTVSTGYFETLGIPLLAGRTFGRWDTLESPGVVVVSADLARRIWPGEAAVGKVLTTRARGFGPLGRTLRQSQDYEVVGVVGDVKNSTLASAAEPAIYFIQTQFPYRNMNFVVRAGGAARGAAADGPGDVAQLAAVVREEVKRLDPNLPLADVRELAGILDDSTASSRFVLALMGLFAALALGLAAVGIYGVLSYAVAQRRGEIGVRLALGAEGSRVLGMVLAEGMALVGLGLAVGLVAALLLGRFMASLLFGVAPTDAVAFGGALAVILAVALAACYVPARRASAVHPVEALRSE